MGDVSPSLGLSSGRLSSGEGVRRAEFLGPGPSALGVGLSPSPPPRGHEERRGERHVPKFARSAREPPGSPTWQRSLPRPSQESPHVLSPELRRPKGASSHVGSAVSDYVLGDPPLQRKKKKKARARAGRKAESRAGREPRRLARAHTFAGA